MSQLVELNLNLHPKQGEALLTKATELLYGGAAGGGKSHLMRVAFILWCAEIAGLQVYIFRRIRDDLVKNHMEGPKGFRSLLAPWVNAGFATLVEDEIRFWNGSKIYLCHCKDEKDIYKYQGAEIHVLGVDELTHFTDTMYRFLRNRVRMVGIKVPAKYQGLFPRILASANPGNIGHLWVKRTFIDGAMPMDLRQRPPGDGGMLRQFIPARLDDNPSMSEDDPGYEGRLEGLGSEALVRAMRWGDWNVVDGAFFDCWASEKHIISPFPIPATWTRFRSMDWGFAKPFSVGWWAVSDGDMLPSGHKLPRGALVRYREWYGAKEPDVGLRLTAEEIVDGIKSREYEGERALIRYTVVDPAMFSEDGGPSHAERMMLRGIPMIRADNRRVPQHGAMGGWDQMRARMVGTDEGPMVYCFTTCLDSVRTIPVLQHDVMRPEDMNTDGEDHAADDWRYACMSRPWVRPVPVKKADSQIVIGSKSTLTMDEAWKSVKPARRGRV